MTTKTIGTVATRNRHERRTGRRVLALALVAVTGASACGPTDSQIPPPDPPAITQVAALSILDKLPPSLKTAARNAKDLVGIFNDIKQGVNAALAIAQFLGFIDGQPDPMVALKNDIATSELALSWQAALAWVDGAQDLASTAIAELRMEPLPFDPQSPTGALIDDNSIKATMQMGVDPSGVPDLQHSGFMRANVEAATDGPWKSVISLRPEKSQDPSNASTLLVYDWRLGVPALLDIVARRVAAIAGSDPTFSTSAHKTELMNLRATIAGHYQKMTNGVTCDYQLLASNYLTWVIKSPSLPPLVSYPIDNNLHQPRIPTTYQVQVACADIYTGESEFDQWAWPNNYVQCRSCVPSAGVSVCSVDMTCAQRNQDAAVARLNSNKNTFRRDVLAAMPLFESQSIMDALYLDAHSDLDLTQQWQMIPLEAAPPHLCVDSGVNPPVSGTGSPVHVQPCVYSNEQWWEYDRRSGVIHNPFYDLCLEVQPASDVVLDQLIPGVPAVAAPCEPPTTTRQQWTYDPLGKALRSAEGTFLDVQSGNLQPGTPVWLWDLNGQAAQLWHADQPVSLQRAVPANCGRLNAGEGLKPGEAARSCDNRFSLTLQGDGNLVLQGMIAFNPPPPPPAPGGTTVTPWQSGTTGLLSDTLIMQSDGNLVLYDWLGGAVWNTGTRNHPGAYFTIENNGNMIVHDPNGSSLWASNTCCY